MESNNPGAKMLLTVEEAAQTLGISRSKVYEMIRSEEIPSVKLWGSRRIPKDQLREWINEQVIFVTPEGVQ